MRGRYSDMARDSSSVTSSMPSFATEKPEEKSTETVKSKPAKSFLKDFVDKIPTPVQDAIADRFGGAIGMVEK